MGSWKCWYNYTVVLLWSSAVRYNSSLPFFQNWKLSFEILDRKCGWFENNDESQRKVEIIVLKKCPGLWNWKNSFYNCEYFSDLIISSKRPEDVLAFIQDKWKFEALVYQKEITKEELDVEAACEKFCLENKIIFHAIWGSTLYHKDDLPYAVKR